MLRRPSFGRSCAFCPCGHLTEPMQLYRCDMARTVSIASAGVSVATRQRALYRAALGRLPWRKQLVAQAIKGAFRLARDDTPGYTRTGLSRSAVPRYGMLTKTSVALLLEDEPLIALDLEQMLEEAGFDVSIVMTCADASAWLEIHRPDIVIVDIELRDGRPDHFVERLVHDDVPFIVHSGDHPDQHAGTPFAQGLWISKPAEPDELTGAARALLAAR